MNNSKQRLNVPHSISFYPERGTAEIIVPLFYHTQLEKTAPILFMVAAHAVEVLKCGDDADHLLGEQLEQSLNLFVEAFERVI